MIGRRWPSEHSNAWLHLLVKNPTLETGLANPSKYVRGSIIIAEMFQFTRTAINFSCSRIVKFIFFIIYLYRI